MFVRGLPADFPGAVFVVLHIPTQSTSLLPRILSRAGHLPASHAIDGMTIQPGRIYVAPPDNHLLVEPDVVRVVRGPRENRHRPAVDPLFRSAAMAHGPRVVGVILSGTLDDGTLGMGIVKACGGITVVQDPKDALYPGMPQSALNNVEVDYCLPMTAIPPLIARLVHQAVEEAGGHVTDDLQQETEAIKLKGAVGSDDQPGVPSVYACPECHGVLWELQEGRVLRYRCRVGHAYTADSLFADHNETLEDALWAALRALEENVSMARRLADHARKHDFEATAQRFDKRAEENAIHAESLREVLLTRQTPVIDVSENGA